MSSHLVHVGPNGTFKASGIHTTTLRDIDELVAKLARAPRRLVLHFHGGLVGEASGMATATSMAPVYEQADADSVALIWETDILTTVRDNLSELSGTKLFRKLVIYAIRHALPRVGSEVPGRGGEALVPLSVAEAIWRGDLPVSPSSSAARSALGAGTEAEWAAQQDEVLAQVTADVSSDVDLAEAWEDETGTELAPGRDITLLVVARYIAAIVFRVVTRFIRGRDHGLVASVVEETLREVYMADLGRWVWSGMKEKAVGMWQPDGGRVGGEHVGTALLERLVGLQQRTGIELHVVGHSAGAVAIAGLLEARRTRYPKLAITSIALLAPAVRSDLFMDQFAAELVAGNTPRVRVFTMDDVTERRSAMLAEISPALAWVYPSSLLYFISGCLEDDDGDTALLGLHRGLTGRAPYDHPPVSTLAEYLGAESRLVLSPSDDDALPGFASRSLTHGGFDDDEATRASLVKWIGG